MSEKKKGFAQNHFLYLKKDAGFTLIELLIVIAIIAIIAAVAFVALDPLTRFKDARDSSRWSDISGITTAVKIDQVDNRGSYLPAISALVDGQVYMIGTGTTGCDDDNVNCDTNITDDTSCVDLTGLVDEGYIGAIPISQNGTGIWTSSFTGYTLSVTSSILTVRSCESENTTEIFVVQ